MEVTEGVSNQDDGTALLCVFRGIAFREQGFHEAAREALKEALRSKKRDPVVRHRALLERAKSYLSEGKRALARKDLERILAEDSDYDGLRELLDTLNDGAATPDPIAPPQHETRYVTTRRNFRKEALPRPHNPTPSQHRANRRDRPDLCGDATTPSGLSR